MRLKNNRFFSGASVYFFANITNAAIPFLLLPILTRYMTPEEYGKIAMFQTLIIALSAITGLSVHGAANRKYYDGNVTDTEMREYIASCLQILVFSTVVATTLMLFFGEAFTKWLGLELDLMVLAVLMSGASFILMIRMGQWQVRHEARKFGALQISKSLIDFGLSLILVVVLLQGATGRIIGQAVAVVICSFLALCLLHKDRLLAFFVWRPDNIREALRFGIPLLPHIVGGFLLTAADRFFINSKLGIEQAGIYMVAVQMSLALTIIFGSINQAYVPWLFEKLKKDEMHSKIKIVRNTYIYFFAVLLMSVLAFLIGPFFVTFVAGEEYKYAGDIIGWLCLGQVFNGMYLMVTNYIFFSKKTGLLSIATFVSGGLNLVLMIFLISALGIKGAAVSFAIACFVKFILTWWVAAIRHPMPWLEFDKILFRSAL